MINPINNVTPDDTIGQIVSVDEHAGYLLETIGLDPAAEKRKTLRSVCWQRKWSEVEILQWVKENCGSAGEQNTGSADAADSEKTIKEWCSYSNEKIEEIQKIHTEISGAFPRVHRIHGNQYPWLKNMQQPFEQFTKILKEYCFFEKNEFYPLAKKPANHEKKGKNMMTADIDEVSDTLENTQTRLMAFMGEIREKGNGFRNPPVACSTMRILNQNFKILFDSLETQFEI